MGACLNKIGRRAVAHGFLGCGLMCMRLPDGPMGDECP